MAAAIQPDGHGSCLYQLLNAIKVIADGRGSAEPGKSKNLLGKKLSLEPRPLRALVAEFYPLWGPSCQISLL